MLFVFLVLFPITTMSPILSSQGVVLATAMAVSGTVILLAFRLQKSFPGDQKVLRPCISSEGKKRVQKKKKRVHFAKEVMDQDGKSSYCSSSSVSAASSRFKKNGGEVRGMPENRVALYNGILRDRGVHRLAYSY